MLVREQPSLALDLAGYNREAEEEGRNLGGHIPLEEEESLRLSPLTLPHCLSADRAMRRRGKQRFPWVRSPHARQVWLGLRNSAAHWPSLRGLLAPPDSPRTVLSPMGVGD